MSGAAEETSCALDLDDDDHDVIAGAGRALEAGLELKRWWERVEAENSYADKFQEAFVHSRPEDHSFGFFETAHLAAGETEVIGNVQQQLFHRPKAGTPHFIQEQIREFVLRYFMRVSVYRTPQPEPETSDLPGPLQFLSQFPDDDDYRLQGFGYSQRYYKELTTGEIGKFRESERDEIIDMRDLQRHYDWLIVRNPIVDFQMNLRPLGMHGPEVTLPIPAANWVLLSPDTITIDEDPGEGLLARYGIGYAFMRDPGEPGMFAYGPGQLEPTVQLMVWEVKENGDVLVKMTFVSEAPEALLNVSVNPLDWGFQAADLLTAGLFRGTLQPFRAAANWLPFSKVKFDPVYPAVRALNLMTANVAGKQLGISKREINKTLTYVHFLQHYNAILGARQTWEQFRDWTDEDSLPGWVKSGDSA